MGKRFFDTEMFNKVWFRKLKPKYKSFWMFVLCNCDLAGIWECDFEACEFFIGEKISENEIIEHFKTQLLRIDNKRFIIKDFIEFQNGNTLNPKSPVHQKIINILEKHTLYDRVLNRVLYTQVVEVGVIVEDGVEVKEKPKNPQLDFPFDSEKFTTIWALLLSTKNWRKKEASALQASLKKLAKFSESEAIQMMENCIAGEWKGLVELKPHERNKAGPIEKILSINEQQDQELKLKYNQ